MDSPTNKKLVHNLQELFGRRYHTCIKQTNHIWGQGHCAI